MKARIELKCYMYDAKSVQILDMSDRLILKPIIVATMAF